MAASSIPVASQAPSEVIEMFKDLYKQFLGAKRKSGREVNIFCEVGEIFSR